MTDAREKIKELNNRRGHIKRTLTNFKKHVEGLDGNVLTVRQRTELQLRVSGIQELYSLFDDVQYKIETLTTSETDIPKALEERDSFDSEYYSILAKAQCLINNEDEEADNSNASADNQSFQTSSVKLPTISLPEYDGSYEHWLEYRDIFLSLVHNCRSIPKIQKFHYLKSSLKGSARLVIDSVEFSADNYIVAWELLLNRYDNSTLLAQKHVKSLFSMPSVTKESSPQIRKLIDITLKNLRALKLLGESIEHWDILIIHMVVSKLDQTTEREWEQYKNSLSVTDDSKRIKLDNLMKFLRQKADMLETLSHSVSHSSPKANSTQNKSSNNSSTQKVNCNIVTQKPDTNTNTKTKQSRKRTCCMCNASHPLYSCQKFLDLGLQERKQLVRRHEICENCFRNGHTAAECRYGPCRRCEKKHNSLICDIVVGSQEHNRSVALHSLAEVPTAADLPASSSNTSHTHAQSQSYSIQVNNAHPDINAQSSPEQYESVLLSTALVEIPDKFGNLHQVRAILDNGSDRCFITQSLCDKLNVKLIKSTQNVQGVAYSMTQSTKYCNIELRSLDKTFATYVQCLVLPGITSSLPNFTLPRKKFSIPDNIVLADPTFNESQNIDILIGANLFWDLLTEGKIKLNNGPYIINTKLGWIISGSVLDYPRKSNHVNCNLTQSIDIQSLDKQVRSFWELEELPISTKSADSRSDDERACEDHFHNTMKRTADGRFIVRIPFKYEPDTLGDTFAQAERRFYALEKRLERYPEYKKLYTEFMNEYETLGHMSRITTYGTPHYFMPHHGVFRPYATSTKLRVVYNASAASRSGRSLNDLQYVGPPIQGDLISILLRFRENKYVACADIEKMYRQVLIDKEQRDLQLILWRETKSDPLGIYQLNTVTYGTASAPFLSCRCLKQLAQECDDPDVARTIREDFYVDDLICGNNDKSTLIQICNDTAKVLHTGCFPLRKWVYNFNADSSSVDMPNDAKDFSLGEHVHSKTLGLGWYPHCDELYFHTQFDFNTKPITKRTILSGASQIYDPLGLLSPVITQAKILLQKCWLLKLDWDQPLPDDVTQVWKRFINNLFMLNKIRVPRFVMCEHPVNTELHIFTDASQAAYGTCAYVRTIDNASTVTVRLLCSKGRVASIKPVMTIPRLELCGALVGARLYEKIRSSLRSSFDKVVFWTDSTIVLSWLQTPPNILKTYVQNRAGEIHELTKGHSWRHVSGVDNPAKSAGLSTPLTVSRGQSVDALNVNNLWWSGPHFLHDPEFDSLNEETRLKISTENLPELKIHDAHTLLTRQTTEENLFPFSRFSQYNRMQRAAAYVLRFIHNTRCKDDRWKGPLSTSELNKSTITLASLSQRESFPDARDSLLRKGQVNKTQTQLAKLDLFIDENKLIRVGGRLKNSPNFDFDKKHPILISGKHQLSLLLFRYEHNRLMHAGPQMLLFTIREAWWPLGGRNLARQTCHKCIKCVRMRGKIVTPKMADLPKERLDYGFPFIHCGVDYAGPLLVLNRKGRGARTVKAYVCLFICFTTRAVHLELVSDLTSEAYLLALKRFISRRGKPAEIFSDNGRNFVGLMNDFNKFLSTCSNDIKEYATAQNIKFKMIPPYASHFGGLWEAGVKSCKHHLRRVVGNAHLTFEELSTVLTQVEAILNSRPLTPMSTDPHDYLPLSPAHFLVGRPMTAPVCADVTAVPTHRLTRYQRVEQIRQHFWSRWSKEYVSELQTRGKWRENQDCLKKNTLVLMKDDNQPPLKWGLGRIVDVFPGKDGVARVADIQTASGIVRRAFSKICPLPIRDE